MKHPFVSIWLCMAAAVAAQKANAEAPDVRHGAVEEAPAPAVEAGFTATWQHASDDDLLDEGAASFDLLTAVSLGPGTLTVYLEGSSSPRDGGVTASLPDVNADVGTALDGNDNGRFQISELHYGLKSGAMGAVAGLLDPAGFIDTSEVANDEATQFLNATLVNNPTIELPDYVPGVALYRDAGAKDPGFTLLLTASHGLADTPDRSYSQLFDLREEGRGLFAAAELHWQLGELTPRLGAWTHTADHDRLDGEPGTRRNAGGYAVLDGSSGTLGWNLRAGFADAQVSQAAWFLGAAVERPAGPAVLGLGMTRSGISADARQRDPSLGDITQMELQARFDLGAGRSLTPSLQHVRNPGFDAGGSQVDREVWVGGVRLSGAF